MPWKFVCRFWITGWRTRGSPSLTAYCAHSLCEKSPATAPVYRVYGTAFPSRGLGTHSIKCAGNLLTFQGSIAVLRSGMANVKRSFQAVSMSMYPLASPAVGTVCKTVLRRTLKRQFESEICRPKPSDNASA